jgi:hypothetical protein
LWDGAGVENLATACDRLSLKEAAMPNRTHSPIGHQRFNPRQTLVRSALFLLAVLLVKAPLRAQQAASGAPDSDKQTIQMLLQRIERLEARVSQLETARTTSTQVAAASVPSSQVTTPPMAPPAAEAEPHPEQETEHLEPERMDMSKTLLRMRGFGDIAFHGSNQPGSTTAFSLGQLNLFVTSDISEKFKFLGEIVFEGGPDDIYGVPSGETNKFSVDLERYLLQYSHNDYFNLSVGRYHTAIGFYNTAYHHSTWFQTTTGRPLLFEFEDRGGILPIHNVGVSATGRIPSGALGLHYIAEVGNGRSSRSPLDQEPVQNEIDENTHKAYNLALFARPIAVQGLQFGFSAYRDLLTPVASPSVGETILAAHAVYQLPNFEWLNEAMVIRHSLQGTSQVFNTPAFYTQLSKRFGAYRPYFRYQYINASSSEPIFPDVRLRAGPSAGLRYDASEAVALKLQYDYTALRQQAGTNSLTLQLGFTF